MKYNTATVGTSATVDVPACSALIESSSSSQRSLRNSNHAGHGYASLMIAAGVNVKALSTFMGHANIRITLDQ